MGKWIWNKTDGSVAVITAVATDAITTTRLLGGSDNTWQNVDVWCIDPFVLTLEKVTTNPYGVQDTTQSEEMLVTARSTDTCSVPTGGRGYNGTVANTFDASDYAYLHVTSPIVERLKDIISVLAAQMNTNVTDLDNVESGASFYAVATGSSNVFAVSLSPVPTAYAAGLAVRFKANHTINGTATLNVNGLGAVTLKRKDGATNLTSGDIQNGQLVTVVYDGTNFQMQSPIGQETGMQLTVEAKTVEYTVLDTDVGKLFTNKGATRRVDLTLPSAAAGLNNQVAVYAAQYLVLRAAAGDTLADGSSTTTATKPGFYTNTPYNGLSVAALDADIWAVGFKIGTWTQLTLKGYYMGGNTGSKSAAIDDMNFDVETSAAIAATLNTAKSPGAGVSGRAKGYVMGGDTGSVTDVIEDLVFIAETSDVIAATLDTARQSGAGVQSSTKGYLLGGTTGSNSNAIDDLSFASETSAAIAATLPTAKRFTAGVSSATKGYAVGGFVAADTNGIAALTFSNEACAAIVATLGTARDQLSGGQSSTKGYTFGGHTSGAVDTIDALVFSGETNGSIVTVLGTARALSGTTSAPAKAYVMGGTTTVNSIEAFVFSGETISTLGATLDSGRGEGGTVSAS